jgi:hypothetical protein
MLSLSRERVKIHIAIKKELQRVSKFLAIVCNNSIFDMGIENGNISMVIIVTV